MNSWLCGTSYFLPDWKRLLDRVAEIPDALAALAQWHADELRRGAEAEGFWKASPRHAEFAAWLTSQNVQEQLPAHLRTCW
jgi:hypothetical protein